MELRTRVCYKTCFCFWLRQDNSKTTFSDGSGQIPHSISLVGSSPTLFGEILPTNRKKWDATKQLPSVALLFLQLASMGGMIRWGLQSQQRFWREDFSPKKDPCPELPSLTARRRGRNLGKDWWQGKSLGILEVSTCSLSGIRDFTGRLRRSLDFIHFCMINCTISGLCGDLRRTSSTKNCRELSSMTATVSSRNSLKVNWTGRIFIVLF